MSIKGTVISRSRPKGIRREGPFDCRQSGQYRALIARRVSQLPFAPEFANREGEELRCALGSRSTAHGQSRVNTAATRRAISVESSFPVRRMVAPRGGRKLTGRSPRTHTTSGGASPAFSRMISAASVTLFTSLGRRTMDTSSCDFHCSQSAAKCGMWEPNTVQRFGKPPKSFKHSRIRSTSVSSTPTKTKDRIVFPARLARRDMPLSVGCRLSYS